MATKSAQRHRWTYDAFVSFRGEDIRKSFMDHLFKDFGQKGIHVFRDDTDLTLGENISPNLDQVIQESRFLIVIFSKNYASSSWCLRELVKILECKQMGEHKHQVRIIYYDVKPDVVRKQTESFAEAFVEHEFSNRTEVAKWKEVLCMTANLSGWDLQDMANGFESKFIDSISKEILKALCHEPLHVGENLVGVDARVNEMNLLRFIGTRNVNMIGICGISGIGKTTLAKAIYNSMCIHFEECIFCEDVQGVTKQQGLRQLQMQLINSIMKTEAVNILNVSQGIMVIKQRMPAKPVLLVLDDVDHREQLEALAGSPNWFFPGSFIIFTSKDKQLLRSHKVDEIYDMPFLRYREAYELFSMYAFGKTHNAEDFEELAYQVVRYLQGHPLALKILGSFLYDKPIHVWKSEVDRLQTYPNAEIQKKLRPSFDGLDFDQKRIFLDISCSLIGESKSFVASVLDSDDCFADVSIEVLVDKSLLTISRDDTSLQMHELIRSMAREIVREESNSPGHRSRLWNLSDVHNVLDENMATKTIEVLDLLLEESSQKLHIDGKAFAHMKNLRILKICDKKLRNFWHPFDLKLWNDSKVNYSGRLEFLSNNLRLFYWHGCPFKFFPSDFCPRNIVAIDLSYSRIENLWTTPKCFRRLKVMKLSHCRKLKSTPDFTRIANLEELILEGCVNLVKLHPSFGMLKRLVVLNMRDCKRFRRFPCRVEMDSLEVMILSGCSKVDKLPEFFGEFPTLREFYVDGTTITKFPSFIFSRYNLQVLEFGQREKNWCRWWTSISQPSWVMPSLASFCSLRKLNFSHCNILEMSDSIRGLSCLESLCLEGNNFTSLPIGCLSQLFRLQHLVLSGCKKLKVLPELPPNLWSLDARDCTSLHELEGPLSYNNHLSLTMFFDSCPKLFRNVSIESQVVCHKPNSSITIHTCRNQFSSFLRYMKFPSNTCGIFKAQERHDFLEINLIHHGNRIPQWFTNQSMGNHVKVELPPDWCFNKFRGYGTCVVFKPKKSYGSKGYWITPRYYVDNFDGTSLVGCYPFRHDSIGIPKSNIIWFRFTNKGNWRWTEAKKFVTFSFEENDDVEVKECGIRLVFDKDIQGEEMNLNITQDLPTPTQDGGSLTIWRNVQSTHWSW